MLFFSKKDNKRNLTLFKNDVLVKIIIFSKDRACQLDCLLNSMSDNFNYQPIHCTILYTVSSEKYENGYRRLFTMHSSDIQWQREKNFKDDLIGICNNISNENPLMFLVDDDIFFKPVHLDKLLKHFTESHLFASLRVDRSYKRNKSPKFSFGRDILEWNWKYYRKSLSTWHYPFSVDGNVFNSSVIKKILNNIDFKAPNSLEGAMHQYRKQKWIKEKKWAVAPLNAVLFNNPMNKVQLEGETWNQNISPLEINEKFLNGFRIDHKKLADCTPSGIHFAASVEFCKY